MIKQTIREKIDFIKMSGNPPEGIELHDLNQALDTMKNTNITEGEYQEFTIEALYEKAKAINNLYKRIKCTNS